MSSSTSPPRRSAGTVYAGALIAAETGAPVSTPAATTRERRSRSVMIPSVPSPRSTTTEVAPASAIRRAASRIDVSGEQITSGGAHQLGHRPQRRVGRRLGRRAAGRLQQRARHVAHAGRARQQRQRHLGADAVAERVLRRDRREPGRQPRQHRGVPEQLAGAEQVQHAAVVDDLDRSAAHYPQVLDRPGALVEDLGPGRVELHFGRLGHALHVRGIERVEGRVRSEEFGHVLHANLRYINSLTPARGRGDTRRTWIRLRRAAGTVR